MSEPTFPRVPWRPGLPAAAWLLAAAGCVQGPAEPPPTPAATTRPVPTLGPDEAVPQPADGADARRQNAGPDHPQRDPRSR